MADMSGWNQPKKSWHYPNTESAIRSVAHCNEDPIPVFTFLPDLILDELDLKTVENEDSDCSSCSNDSDTSLAAEGHLQENKPKPFTQGQLNDLVCDLGLSEKASEIPASRLDEHNILDSQIKITFYLDRDEVLIQYFTEENNFVFCNDIEAFPLAMCLLQYKPDDLRLFIDSPQNSLKCVSLNYENKFASVPVGFSVV